MSKRVAKQGAFRLQQCDDCGEIIYPPREMCGGCLSANVHWQPHVGEGEVLAVSKLGHSFDPVFEQAGYPEILSVGLDDGPVIIALARDPDIKAGGRVTLDVDDASPGGPVIVARQTKKAKKTKKED